MTNENSDNKKYNPKIIEPQYYQIWEERGYFELDSNKEIQEENKKFSLMMPPPNITGALHMGHALTYTLQDIITRYKRMSGFRVLWQAGIDHAGIATQNIVEKQLLQKGIKKEDIGREAFLKEIWDWKEKSGGTILSQLKSLGASPNWKRLRFTMDKGLQNAVKKAFVEWYDKGLIIQGDYMVNWCTHDGALSDIEVEHEENNGKLYYIKYFIKDENDFVIVATTRPETYFGDTAVMVNPNDPRYKHLIGKKVVLPLINKEIEIIGESFVDMDFGSGVVKVTPAHDINDYEVGKRHNLEFITIFDKFGILNDYCGEFSGIERLQARNKIVTKLKDEGFIEKIEDYKNQIGKCYRCGNIVEPYISKQWFVKKEIAKEAIKKVNQKESRFYPAQWLNNYNAWMNELHNWCISRQLWWGHRIPVFYCDICNIKIASINESESCTKCKTKMRQDSDVLDTWFSSGLWAFSTLGWGNIDSNISQKEQNKIKALYNDDDLKDFYPNSLLITSFDILFFWVARMIFSGESLLGALPFKDIYLHALICDEFGNKMSKSKGNVINPLDLIQKYSSDILRFSLSYNCIQGRDIRISEKSLNIGNTLSLKVINALNFLLLYKDQQNGEFIEIENINSPLGKYIYEKFNICVLNIRNALDNYRFNDASVAIYKFLFNDFCDWGIEFVKQEKNAVFELGAIFRESMKLLHPFMPFLSEFAYQSINGTSLKNAKSIMIEKFPTYKENIAKIIEFDVIKDIVISIRRAKTIIDFANKEIPLCYIKLNLNLNNLNYELLKIFIPKLSKCKNIEFIKTAPKNCLFDIGNEAEIYIPIKNINVNEIIEKLTNKKEKITKEKEKLESLINNKNFIKNAPKDLVESNKIALSEKIEKIEKIENEISLLNH